jgi:NTE family protein
VLDVTFDSIPDPDEREIFMNMPTSFVLPDEDIDRLREIAGRLLRQSVDYEALVHDLGGSLSK